MEQSANNTGSQQPHSPSKGKGKSSPLDQLQTELDALENSEEKLKKVLALMKACMAQNGSPDFITFWKARKMILDIFQEKIPSPIKSALWEDYCSLVKEAGRLKEIFEKQSAFTIEQIDIALRALEEEIAQYPRPVETSAPFRFSSFCKALKDTYPYYQELQFQLGFLNAQASLIHALRKELLHTEMRVRKKNQFFHRLSAAGDQVFPRRKELMQKVSKQFAHDVGLFFTVNFSENTGDSKFYLLREEIKALQSMAKQLTLTPSSFTQTRETLGKCWNMLKDWEKEYKKERTKKKALEHRKEKDEQKREVQKRDKERNRQQQIADIEQRIQSVLEDIDQSASLSLTENLHRIKEQIHQLNLSDAENERFRELLTPMEDAIEAKEEERLLQLLKNSKQEAIPQLKEMLQSLREKREATKNTIEEYRKASGSSGLNFGKSLYFSDQLNVEKDRLRAIQEKILQIEKMIEDLPQRQTEE